ncbi:hypothetical protein [Arthrobacter sp. 131MFCol6.1]|uniref:hypothetical protein n=1 Tax=Arthrobacter sp. 131MFCol6.1 TaxID=1157944 RepID=UPI003FA414DC
MRIEVQDHGTGVDTESARMYSTPMYGGYVIPGQSMTLVSGDRFRGTYETIFTFPEFITSGKWIFVPHIVDLAGNEQQFAVDDAMYSIGIYPTVVSAQDRDAPTVTTSLSKKIVDITDGPGKTTITVNAQDPGVGIPADATMRFGELFNEKAFTNSSIHPNLGIFVGNFEYPQYSPDNDSRGTKDYYIRGLADANGNSTGTSYGGNFVVATRPLRGKRPELRSSEGTLTAAWTAHYDMLGVLEYEAEISGSAGVRTIRTSATEASLNDLPAGTYTARVRARNQLGWGEWTTPSDPLVHTLVTLTGSTPVISGAPTVGRTLSATTGTWTAGSTFAYLWLADGIAVSGATGSTLVLAPDHVGKTMTVQITGSKPGYTILSKKSAATAAVTAGPFSAAPTPKITGTAMVGSILTASPGTWSPTPATLQYQWYRDGVPIAGATTATRTLTATDAGAPLTVKVTGTKPGYTTTAMTSTPTAAVAKASLGTATPTITGTARVGSTLTANAGSWTPAPGALTYQWYRSGMPVTGATAATRMLTADDAGSPLTVQVTGSRPGYTTAVVSSAPTMAVAKASLVTAIPAITGTAKVGSSLTANPGTWTPAPVTLTYQWYRSGVAIVGATTATRMLALNDAGATLTVKVTGAKPGYATASVTSAPTAGVPADSLATAVPKITGTAKVDSTLTVLTEPWGPAPVALTYQWYAGGVVIPGAKLSTYKATPAYVGKVITVSVTGTKAGYFTATKTSAPTAAVAKGSLVAAPPAITGYARVGSTLTANPGTWEPAQVTLNYQWYRSGVAIVGANAATYKPTTADLTKVLTVRVTGSQTGYASRSKTSTATATVTMGLVGPDPMIFGGSAFFSTLTVYPGAWSPVPVTLRYQWYRDGVPVIGATAATFTPDWDDLWFKRLITVRVSASKTGYTTVKKTSLPYRTWI